VPSFDRAQQKHASRDGPSNTVNTNFSPAQSGTHVPGVGIEGGGWLNLGTSQVMGVRDPSR
jgi:hypothetical protein